MDYHFYDKLGITSHWWFDSKDSLIKALMERHCQGKWNEKNCLDFGGGMHTEFGTCLDIDKRLARHNEHFFCVDVENAKQLKKFKDFDFAVVSELLEHLDDKKVVKNIKACLRKGGRVFATVPALKELWSRHDEEMEHRKRYTVAELKELFEKAGFKTIEAGYWNSHMLPFIWIAKKANKGGISKNNALVEAWFRKVLGFENRQISKGKRYGIGATVYGVFEA